MLLVRLARVDGDRPRAEELDVLHFGGVGGGEIRDRDGGDAGGELAADAAAEDEVWEVARVDEGVY